MESFIQLAIVLVGTGAFWTYLHNKDKQRQDAHEALTTRLLQEVQRLESKVDQLLKEKEELIGLVTTLKVELATVKPATAAKKVAKGQNKAA